MASSMTLSNCKGPEWGRQRKYGGQWQEMRVGAVRDLIMQCPVDSDAWERDLNTKNNRSLDKLKLKWKTLEARLSRNLF